MKKMGPTHIKSPHGHVSSSSDFRILELWKYMYSSGILIDSWLMTQVWVKFLVSKYCLGSRILIHIGSLFEYPLVNIRVFYVKTSTYYFFGFKLVFIKLEFLMLLFKSSNILYGICGYFSFTLSFLLYIYVRYIIISCVLLLSWKYGRSDYTHTHIASC